MRFYALSAVACAVCVNGAHGFDFIVYDDGESGASLDVRLSLFSVGDPRSISFLVVNDSPSDSVVTSVYFEAGHAIAALMEPRFREGPGDVLFSPWASPGDPDEVTNLTGSGLWGDPWTETGLAFGSAIPTSTFGIASGESARFEFDIGPWWIDRDDISEAIDNNSFRIAIHVETVTPGGQFSVWAVTPSPGGLALLVGGGLLATRRRR